jgi:ArsR family transcriptional regulator
LKAQKEGTVATQWSDRIGFSLDNDTTFTTMQHAIMKSKKLSVQRKAEIFKALGHSTWLQIVEKLADGEQCVCVLLEMFDVDMSTLSRHLSVLKNAGIVSDERRGKNIFYCLKCPCTVKMFDCMEKILTERQKIAQPMKAGSVGDSRSAQRLFTAQSCTTTM